MNRDIAQRLLLLLRDGTSGWGSATDGSLKVYLDMIERFPSSEVAEAAIQRIIGEWVSNTRPTPGYLRMTYNAEAGRLAPEAIAIAACAWCDGSLWVECSDDRRHASFCRHRGTSFGAPGDCFCHAVIPCPACASGNPTSPTPEQRRIPPFSEVRSIASVAYAEECERQGREPNWDLFNSLLGKV